MSGTQYSVFHDSNLRKWLMGRIVVLVRNERNASNVLRREKARGNTHDLIRIPPPCYDEATI